MKQQRSQPNQNSLRASNVTKGEPMYIERIRNFDADKLSLDEIVELAAFARVFREEYEKNGGEVPTWLSDSLKGLRREINARQLDSVEKTLREKLSRLEALKPTEQKRQELQAEIDALKSRLPQSVGA